MIRPRPEYEALRAARQRQETEAFTDAYRQWAGIEGTHAQAVRRCGVRRTRFRGLAKTALGPLLIAAGLTLIRVAAWLAGAPRATTRPTAFAALKPLPI